LKSLLDHVDEREAVMTPFDSLDDEVTALIYEEGAGIEKAAVAYLESHGR
jgi:hypothetical protein